MTRALIFYYLTYSPRALAKIFFSSLNSVKTDFFCQKIFFVKKKYIYLSNPVYLEVEGPKSLCPEQSGFFFLWQSFYTISFNSCFTFIIFILNHFNNFVTESIFFTLIYPIFLKHKSS